MYSTEQIIAALKKSNGLISLAAKAIECSPETIRARAKREPEIQAAIDNARDSLVDLAEQKLRSALNKGHPWAIALVLKTLGKNRGYVERGELTGADGAPLGVEMDDTARAARLAAILESARNRRDQLPVDDGQSDLETSTGATE